MGLFYHLCTIDRLTEERAQHSEVYEANRSQCIMTTLSISDENKRVRCCDITESDPHNHALPSSHRPTPSLIPKSLPSRALVPPFSSPFQLHTNLLITAHTTTLFRSPSMLTTPQAFSLQIALTLSFSQSHLANHEGIFPLLVCRTATSLSAVKRTCREVNWIVDHIFIPQ